MLDEEEPGFPGLPQLDMGQDFFHAWGSDQSLPVTGEPAGAAVTTLFRLLLVLTVLAGLGFAAMYALATLVQPDVREMVVPIPADRLPPPRR
jgi:hypothetical protein